MPLCTIWIPTQPSQWYQWHKCASPHLCDIKLCLWSTPRCHGFQGSKLDCSSCYLQNLWNINPSNLKKSFHFILLTFKSLTSGVTFTPRESKYSRRHLTSSTSPTTLIPLFPFSTITLKVCSIPSSSCLVRMNRKAMYVSL